MGAFASRLIAWQRVHGRHDLPWQRNSSPYRIWISEVMLQQTQVAAVIPYYERFVAALPSVRALAQAPEDEVLALWSGLGYYSRARNLQRCARLLVAQHDAQLPGDPQVLASLPGIGRSTAAAIAVFGFGQRAAILDGNARRVLARVFELPGDPTSTAGRKRFWAAAERELPTEGVQAYTQGLMDLGALVCTRTRPACERCPLAELCAARASGRIAEFPHRRRQLPRPRRQALLLVVRASDRVWLVKRPARGVWAGLWSLPQLQLDPGAHGDAAMQHMIAGLDMFAAAGGVRRRELPEIEHVFTHFVLHARPVLLELDRAIATSGAATPLPTLLPPAPHDAGPAAQPQAGESAPIANASRMYCAETPTTAPGHAWSSALSPYVDARWWAQDELSRAPLPAPVKRLLLGLHALPQVRRA